MSAEERKRLRPEGRREGVSAVLQGARLERALGAASIHLRAGRFEEAVAAYGAAAERAPGEPRAWDGLGLAAYRQGRAAAAKVSFERAAALDPQSPLFRNHLGIACEALGEIDAAAGHFRAALGLAPNDPALLGSMGRVLFAKREFDAAAGYYRLAAKRAPGNAHLRVSLGSVLCAEKRWEEAASVLREAVRLSPRNWEAHLQLGNALRGLGRLNDALAAYRRASILRPEDGRIHHNIGTALHALGRMDEAAEAYRRAIRSKLPWAASLRQLADIRNRAPGREEAARFEKLLSDEALSEEERADVHLGLALVYDRLGEFDRAFEHLSNGNRMVLAGRRYDPEADRRFADLSIGVFSRAFFAERSFRGSASEVPLFVLGMPRSGTTLVEQILASHPKVFGAGELTIIGDLAAALPARLGKPPAYPEAARSLDKALCEKLAGEVLGRLSSLGDEASRVVDKMPFNFRLLGFIALLFPKARIVHCRRDPLDTLLSCYFTRFEGDFPWSCDLAALGAYYREYERLMSHWREVVRNPWLEVRYEDLADRPEERSRELVAFCGLEWDERCLRYYEHQRPILTASSWQARQPVYRNSVGRWRHYEKHLRFLFRGLEGRCPGFWRRRWEVAQRRAEEWLAGFHGSGSGTSLTRQNGRDRAEARSQALAREG